jgi:ribose 5-phosphate isomerase A
LNAKQAAALEAVKLIQDGMVVGLGSGSTATFAIQAIGARMHAEGLNICGVPTSSVTNELAARLGIPLVDIRETSCIDLTIDGADEVDPNFSLIKGGGGALVREKLVAAASNEVVIICDDSKIKQTLGAFPLPVSVVPFAWQSTLSRLRELCPEVSLRCLPQTKDPYLTDDDCYILDMHFGTIGAPAETERQVKLITGVVDVGLFVGLATKVIVGYADGTAREILR